MTIDLTETFVEEFQKANGNMSEAWRNTIEIAGEAFQDEFTSPKWAWPGVTFSKSGAVVGSPRDIVNLGNLKRSQRVTFKS